MGDRYRSTTSQWKLWHPANGIAFTPASPAAGRPQQPLYPRLDVPRFLHSATIDSTATHQVKPAADEASATGCQNSAPADVKAAAEVARDEPEENAAAEDDDVAGEPPVTDLEFNIPEDIFRAARLAKPGSPESFWSYTLYRGPGEDGDSDAKVKVHYCKSQLTTERVCQYFLNEKVVGFDLEWVADANRTQGPRKNVSLIQLASASRIALFHVSLFPKSDNLVASSFRKIMEDPEITKVGVSIKGDCTRLRKYLGVQSHGLFELSHLYRLVKYSKSGEYRLINRRLVSLAKHVEDHLRLPMFKGQDVRSSDWSQPLSMDQLIYSASDAYAAVQLFSILEMERESLDPKPPRPHPAELGLPIRLADGVTLPIAEEEADEAEENPDDGRTTATLSADFVKSAIDSIEIEVETDAPTTPKAQTPRKPTRKTNEPKDPKILAAEAWLASYRTSKPKIRAAAAALRAYHVWHNNEDVDPLALAKLLRDPPLQTTTVVSYILESIKLEKMPYNKDRLRTEVLALLPDQILELRYKSLAKACESSNSAMTKLTAPAAD